MVDYNNGILNGDEMAPPLTPIKNGWAARGDGWAVHGRTKEEALQKFREAEQRHREIDGRPFWYERRRQETIQEQGGEA